MKKLFCIISIMALSFASASFAQDVAVVYDVKMENGGGLGIEGGAAGAKGLADMIVEKLNDEKLNAEIVDADGLVEYMEANQNGIFVLTQGNTPDTIFQNKGEDDLIYSWLRDGGIGGFIGDYPLYYYWNFYAYKKGNPAAGGGGGYMPSLGKWTSNRPVGLNVLENNNFEFESYADNGNDADPIAYRTDDMEGWFINFHTSCCGTVIPGNEQVATEYAELIANRFAPEAQAVDPTGKVSVVWGKLKSLR